MFLREKIWNYERDVFFVEGDLKLVVLFVTWMDAAVLNAVPLVGAFLLYMDDCDGSIPTTPLKFNMEPEKKPLEKEIPFGNHHFQVPY